MLDETRRQPSNSASRSTAPGVIGQNPMYGNYTNGNYANVNSYNRAQANPLYLHPDNRGGNDRNDGLAGLTENVNRMNLQAPTYHTATKPSPAMTNQSFDGGVGGYQQPYMNGGFVYNGPQYTNQTMQQHNMAQGYGMYQPYVNPAQYQYPQHFMGGHSPMSSGWAPSSRIPSAEVPSLVAPRRGSSSPSQEGDAPGTPLTHYTGHGDYQNGFAVAGRSPNGMYSNNWSTPSSGQAAFKHQSRGSISPRLQLLVQQEPPIPHAIPAPYSPVKPLDRSLENPHGITNVYIRGLLPTTTDELLYALAIRFGEVDSSKSIIDHATGQCKGFGFVKYHNFKDAEDCIRGFHSLGYESSFARESFYSQLKKLHDDGNTNLYVSNLPKEMNEHELGAIFSPHKVCSSRILRDGQGNGRGVGFARFESRDVCEEIIKNFNNAPVAKPGGEQHLIQIRYADTPDQKNLKQQTTTARNFRTAEYESVTQGNTPLFTPASLSHGGHHVRQGYGQEYQDFEQYMKSEAGTHHSYGSGHVRDRLSTVSSHFGTPQGSGVNIQLPTTHAGTPERRAHSTEGPVTSYTKVEDNDTDEPTCEGAEKGAAAANASST